MPRARLGDGSWQLESDVLGHLRRKITEGKVRLAEKYGPPLYGIKTGCNEALVIDQKTRDDIVASDGRSTALIEPFLRGENLQRWRVESEEFFLINIPKEQFAIDEFPAVGDWLRRFKEQLEARATKQKWFELQQAQLSVQATMRAPKILYPEFSQGPKFCFDDKGFLVSNKCFFLPGGFELLSYLNSRAAWFWLFGEASPLRGGKWRLELREQHMAELPIPDFSARAIKSMSEIGRRCFEAATRRLGIQREVQHRLFDLAKVATAQTLSRKLERWWELDFSTFRAEIKKVFHVEIAVNERAEWESYLGKNSEDVRRLTHEIEAGERDSDSIVYSALGLDQTEIALLEASIKGQY